VLALQHADLRDREPFRRPVQRGEMCYGLLGDDDAPGMDTELVRHAQQALGVAHYGMRHAVQAAAARLRAGPATVVRAAIALAQRIDLPRGQAHRLAQLADGAAPLEGGIGGDLRRVDAAGTGALSRAGGAVVLAEDILEHL